MIGAQRLKCVFNIDVQTCHACGGAVKVIACIEDPLVIKKIFIRRGKILVGLEGGVRRKGTIQQIKNRASGAESGWICSVIGAKSQPNRSSISVAFGGHGLYSSYISTSYWIVG